MSSLQEDKCTKNLEKVVKMGIFRVLGSVNSKITLFFFRLLKLESQHVARRMAVHKMHTAVRPGACSIARRKTHGCAQNAHGRATWSRPVARRKAHGRVQNAQGRAT